MADLSNTPAPAPTHPVKSQPLVVAGAIIIAIGALYVGAGIFVPLVLAILLTFALAPLVRALDKLHVPHVVAVLLSVFGAAVVIVLIAFLIVTQLVHLASEIPQYQQIIGKKVRALQESANGSDVFGRIANAIKDFDSGASTVASQPGLPGGAAQPVPVTVVNPPQNPLSFVQGFLSSLLGPLATAAIVTVFVVFLLLEREDFRDRFLKLVSRGDLRTSTKAMNEAGKRVSRYLLVQFTVNLSYGIVFGTGLFLIGIPNAILWGLFAALFRYIPFVGTLIAASIPFALAFAIDPGWSMLLQAVALFVCLEMIVTNAIEPRLYGSSTGLSALAVIVAAMFWATLWGPIGLILATPLTVCLVVLGRYVPQLQFLEIMLGSEPVLVREEQLYQRLISGNTEEAIELAENYIGNNSPEAFYDEVAVPALRLAETDRARNITDLAGRRAVADGMAAVVLEIEQLSEERSEEDDLENVDEPMSVLCIGGRTELDAAAAAMVAQVVRRRGIESKTLPPVAVRQEGIGQIDLEGVDLICLAYLDTNPRTYARFVARRIKRRAPHIKVMVCLLNSAEAVNLEDMTLQLEVDALATSIAMAETRIASMAQSPETAPTQPAADTATPDGAAWLERLQRIASTGDYLEEFIVGIAAAFESQMAIVSVADREDEQTSDQTDPSVEVRRQASVASLSAHVVQSNDLLVIEDVSADTVFAENAFLVENSIQFYAGAPLRAPSGEPLGTLSIIDHEPRKFSQEERALMMQKAEDLMAQVFSGEMLVESGLQNQRQTRTDDEVLAT
jgi:predicted PurR-regulated permease PerM